MKKLIYITLPIVVILVVSILTRSNNDKNKPSSTTERPSVSASLTPVSSITHGHGLALDTEDPTKVYIATHNGVLLLKNDKELYKVGSATDDYMGFSVHPTNPKIFFSSGHPKTGGNIGFQKSEDAGVSWQKVSNGLEGPVDFHAMTVSPANPDLVFGWFKGKLQKSLDGGKNWEGIYTNFVATQLIAHPKDQKKLYATSPEGEGVMYSFNEGATWHSLSKDLEGGMVNAFAINPGDDKLMLSSSEKMGLAKSADAGKTWQKLEAAIDGEILFFAFSRQNTSLVYALTHTNKIYKSINGGENWNNVR